MDKDIQEINFLMLSEHGPEIFRAETKNEEVLRAVKALV